MLLKYHSSYLRQGINLQGIKEGEMLVLKRVKQKSRKLNVRQTGNASRASSYER